MSTSSADEERSDVIIIDSSSDEEERFVKGQKRSRGSNAHDSESISSASSSPSPKKARRSTVSESEEGEVNESDGGKGRQEDVGGQLQVPSTASAATDSRQGAGRNVAAVPTSSVVFVPPDPPTWQADSLSFELPVFTAKRAGSWPARFKDWTQLFFHHNIAHGAAITPTVALAAYTRYLDSHSGLKAGKRRSAKQASKQSEQSGALEKQLEMFRANGANGQLMNGASAAKGSTTAQAEPAGSVEGGDGAHGGMAAPAPTTSASAAAAAAHELAQRRRYFPSGDDECVVCLRCAHEGHMAADCPNAACRFCRDQGHWDIHCETKRRCQNCRQLGHAAASCGEKLKLTAAEGLACAYCCGSDHLEDDCPDVWRSFRPEADAVRKVVALPISCAVCGGGDHCLSDCAARRHPAHASYLTATRTRYLDPDCGILSIEGAAAESNGGDQPPTRHGEFKVRGHSARNTNVHYSESDDSASEFLDNRLVKQKTQVGQMRISSNIKPPAGTYSNRRPGRGGRNAMPHDAQPPLPQGPPPPGRPPSDVRQPWNARLRPNPMSLPAKPPAPARAEGAARGARGPARGYHNVPPPPSGSGTRAQDEGRNGNARGGFSFRGRGRGDRGRGRGRGRGK
ncbi:hypothetical protein RJ55_03167 [Drechmeria coniospora]|nr:hypothetical protein RJ55_03167 [Drechmeria coniospora]